MRGTWPAGLAKWIDYRVGDALQLLAGEAGPFDFVWQITGRGSTRSFDIRSFDTDPCVQLMAFSFNRSQIGANLGQVREFRLFRLDCRKDAQRQATPLTVT